MVMVMMQNMGKSFIRHTYTKTWVDSELELRMLERACADTEFDGGWDPCVEVKTHPWHHYTHLWRHTNKCEGVLSLVICYYAVTISRIFWQLVITILTKGPWDDKKEGLGGKA